jgi:hypothetical protein
MTAECLIRAVILATGLTLGPAAAGADPALEAWLSEKDALARHGSMRVEARVSGIQLIDPTSVREAPNAGQGHLHYRVDGGPVIATPATSLGFHELAPGAHRVEVSLVGNDHRPLGPVEVLDVTDPAELDPDA